MQTRLRKNLTTFLDFFYLPKIKIIYLHRDFVPHFAVSLILPIKARCRGTPAENTAAGAQYEQIERPSSATGMPLRKIRFWKSASKQNILKT